MKAKNQAKQYLRVKNWEKFQREMEHKGSRRAWIKLHTSLLTDPEFITLPDPVQRDLMFIWVHYASYPDGLMPNNPAALAELIPRVCAESILALIEDGWLVPCTEQQAMDESKARPGPRSQNLLRNLPGIEDREPTQAESARADREAAESRAKGFAQEMAELWNSLGEAKKVRAISGRRAAAVNARAKQAGEEACAEVVRKARASRWCSKLAFNGRGVDFDWCFTDTYFTRILEGKYDDGPGYKELTFEKATSSQMFDADRACQRRGLDPSRMTPEERIAAYNADKLKVVELATARGHSLDGLGLTALADWYKHVTGRWPHE